MIDLSLIVCTYNRAEMLDGMLASFSRTLEFTDVNFELLIIDNNSSDNTRDVALRWQEFPEMCIRYFLETKQGSSNARNRGISEARGEWLWFVDDDIFFHTRWLAGVHTAIHSFPGVAAIAGRILLDFETRVPDWLPDIAHDYYGLTRFGDHSRLLREDEYPISANAGFRRDIFARVGIFRTDLGRRGRSLVSWDETEITLRVKQVGGQIAYTHEALVYHRVSRERLTRRWLYRRVFADGISECRAFSPVHNDGSMLYAGTLVQNMKLVTKKILKKQWSFSDQLYMARHLGFAYQCLVWAVQLK